MSRQDKRVTVFMNLREPLAYIRPLAVFKQEVSIDPISSNLYSSFTWRILFTIVDFTKLTLMAYQA